MDYNSIGRYLTHYEIEIQKLKSENDSRTCRGYNTLSSARKCLTKKYSWAIPSISAVKEIIKHGPIVEIGAGSGYWASLIKNNGGDVVAYDDYSWNYLETHTKVLRGNESKASKHPDRVLFLCWPPYDDDMAYKSAESHFSAGGKKIIYIGEACGGCNANYDFFDFLETNYSLVESVRIPKWDYINDAMFIYEVKNG